MHESEDRRIRDYYKYGDVLKQFDSLDVEIRKLVRRKLKQDIGSYATNTSLTHSGLHSLSDKIKNSKQTAKTEKKCVTEPPAFRVLQQQKILQKPTINPDCNAETLEKISRQIALLISLNRKLLKLMEAFMNN